MRLLRGDTCSMWHPPPPPPNKKFEKATVNPVATDESAQAHPSKRDRKPSLKAQETKGKKSDEPLSTNKQNKLTKSTKPETGDQELFCTCKQPWEDGLLYLDCVGPCKGWFHLKCVGLSHLSEKELNVLTYVCSECQITDLTESHKRETEKRLELLQKKMLIIEGLEAEVEREKEKTQIKTSHFSQQNEQLKVDNKKLCDEVNRLTKLADNGENLLGKSRKDIEALKSKFEKCDIQRIANQKELNKSKTTCQTVTTRSVRLEKDHSKLKAEHSLMSKQHDTVKKTLEVKESLILELNKKIHASKLTILAQKEANKRIIDGAEAENPDHYIEVHDDDVFANTDNENTLGSTNDLKKKDKEIESLKNLISQLEGRVMELTNENDEMSERIDATSAESSRLKEINQLLLNQIKEHNPESLIDQNRTDETNDHDTSHNSNTEPSHLNDTEISNTSFETSFESHQNEDDQDERAQNVREMDRVNEFHLNEINPDEDEICAQAWYEGINACDGKCGLNHNIDYDKLGRGICCWEFEGTCKRHDDCFFCHEIPPVARSDPRVAEIVRLSKAKALKRRPSTNIPPSTPPVPLMSIETNYGLHNINRYQETQQTKQPQAPQIIPGSPQDVNMTAPFLGQYIMQVINMELNRRLALLNLPNERLGGAMA